MAKSDKTGPSKKAAEQRDDKTLLDPRARSDGTELVGRIIDGRYRIESRIAGDQFLELYRGTQIALDRPVIVKILLVGKAAVLKERFEREAKVLSKLDHPGIVHLIEFGVFEDIFPYLVRDYVEGRSISQIVREDGKIAPDKALPMLVQVCEALEHAHESGVIHRDLTPAKIIIDRNNRARITDFGVSRMLSDDETPVTATMPGASLGTPEYASPELASGKTVDRRSDLYSLGAIAYRMISGRLPYEGATHTEIFARRRDGKAPHLVEASGLPRDAARFCAIIDRLLAMDPVQRCSSAGWVAHAFKVSMGEQSLPEATEDATLFGDDGAAAKPSLRPASASAVKEAVRSADDPAEALASRTAVRQEETHDDAATQPNIDFKLGDARNPWEAPPADPGVGPPPPLPSLAPSPPVAPSLGPPTDPPKPTVSPTLTKWPSTFSGIDITAARSDWRLAWIRFVRKLTNYSEQIGLAPKLQRIAESGAGRKTAEAVSKVVSRVESWRIEERFLALGPVKRISATPFGRKIAASPPIAGWAKLPGRTRTALGLSATCVVLALAVITVAASWRSAPPPVVAEQIGGPKKTNLVIASEARNMIQSNQAAQAIEMLEPVVVSAVGYGDPVLHSALALAYVRGGREAESVQHFAITVQKDPNALHDEDVGALVALLALPKKDVERVIPILRDVGPRAITVLKDRSEDRSLNPADRKRAKDALNALGYKPPPAPEHRPRRASTK
jgi:serine/threonine protein kinase